jgi:hypothetical protein
MLDRLLLGRVILKIAALEVGLIALRRRGATSVAGGLTLRY